MIAGLDARSIERIIEIYGKKARNINRASLLDEEEEWLRFEGVHFGDRVRS
jgi:hypothetical protein